MKIEKNKLVFGSVLLVVVLFIIGYTMMVISDGDNKDGSLEQTEIPKLKQEQKDYDSKLDAVNDIKDEREANIPSMYDERMLDSTGVYDPDLMDKEKQRIVDSIYSQGRIDYTENGYRDSASKSSWRDRPFKEDSADVEVPEPITAKELGLEHQLFFASDPKQNPISYLPNTSDLIVEVDGDQILKKDSRLQMRLLKEVRLGSSTLPKNTLVYGIVSFQPNRTLLKIENIAHIPVKLRAYDLQDGLEGIYLENSIRGEVATQVVGDVLDEVNITGVPQVSGITKIFQQHNKGIKVMVANNYKLILRAK